MYAEEDFLQLSGIQHFAFCRRQWALIHIELQWSENLRTVEGHIMHERAHDGSIAEKRGDLIVSRAMPVHSAELGISGEVEINVRTRGVLWIEMICSRHVLTKSTVRPRGACGLKYPVIGSMP